MRYLKKESLVGHFNINLMLVRITIGWQKCVMCVCLGRQTERIRSQKNVRSCDQFHFLLPSVRHSKMKFQATKNNQSPCLVDFVEPLFAFRLLAMQSVAACYIHTYTSTRFLVILLCLHFTFSLGTAQGVTACCKFNL